MRLLLDTHAFLWWMSGDRALPATVEAALKDDDNEVFVSAATAWEIAIKFRAGKLPAAARLVAGFDEIIAGQGFSEIPITIRHGISAANLPLIHKDPFDRMLIAQAIAANLTLVSNEAIFDAYGIMRLW